jgi:ABC-2 type transport system ATP-binding protein
MDEAIIQVEALVKVFAGKSEVRALDGLSLAIPPGGVYGLLGPNGAGKTTLIRVLATLLPPDGGSARVAGLDVRHHPAEVRARIGLAGQSAAVDEVLTGQENVEMVGRLYGLSRAQARRRATEVLARIHLVDAANRQVRTYSGGMRRRLDLAASLVGRPRVLFLDEPTAGLDPASRHDLWALIGELVDTGTTVLLTTQYLEEADRLADRIAVIDHGRLVSEGTPDQLKDQVGGAVLQVAVPEPDRAQTLQVLRGVSAQDPTEDRDRSRILLPAPDGTATLTQALRRLDAVGVAPEDVALRKPTLDEVFAALTGHRATTPTGNGPDPRGGVDHHGQQPEGAAR